MNSATGSESTPTRRICTNVRGPHTATSGMACARSRTKWPKPPTALIASTVLRPSRWITALNYDATLHDATLHVTKVAGIESCRPPRATWRRGVVERLRLRSSPAPCPRRHPAAVSTPDRAAAAPARASRRACRRSPRACARDRRPGRNTVAAPWRRAAAACQRLLDLVRQEAVHRLVFRVGKIFRDEALDQRAIPVRIERRIEPHVPGVEGREGLHHLERQLGSVGDLLRRGPAPQGLPQGLRR